MQHQLNSGYFLIVSITTNKQKIIAFYICLGVNAVKMLRPVNPFQKHYRFMWKEIYFNLRVTEASNR